MKRAACRSRRTGNLVDTSDARTVQLDRPRHVSAGEQAHLKPAPDSAVGHRRVALFAAGLRGLPASRCGGTRRRLTAAGDRCSVYQCAVNTRTIIRADNDAIAFRSSSLSPAPDDDATPCLTDEAAAESTRHRLRGTCRRGSGVGAQGAPPVRHTVRIPMRADLVDEIKNLERQATRSRRSTNGRTATRSPASPNASSSSRRGRASRWHSRSSRLDSAPPRRWWPIPADRRQKDRARGRVVLSYNPDKYPPQLLAATCVSHTSTVEDWADIWRRGRPGRSLSCGRRARYESGQR